MVTYWPLFLSLAFVVGYNGIVLQIMASAALCKLPLYETTAITATILACSILQIHKIEKLTFEKIRNLYLDFYSRDIIIVAIWSYIINDFSARCWIMPLLALFQSHSFTSIVENTFYQHNNKEWLSNINL